MSTDGGRGSSADEQKPLPRHSQPESWSGWPLSQPGALNSAPSRPEEDVEATSRHAGRRRWALWWLALTLGVIGGVMFFLSLDGGQGSGEKRDAEAEQAPEIIKIQ